MNVFWIAKSLYNSCAINVSEQQSYFKLSSNNVTKPKLIKTLSVYFLQVTIFFLEKSDQHDQWSVLNLLTYNFGMKNNFEQGGIVPLTRALLGLWIFHRLLGGGGVWTPPPPMISAPGRRREKRKAAFEKLAKNHFEIISVIFWLRSKLRSPGVKIPKISKMVFSTIKSLFLKVEQRFWYHRVCLVKARRTIYTMTLKGQGQSLTSGQVRPRSRDDRNGSYYISVDSSGQYERTDTNPTSLSLFDQKLLANYGWWRRVTSNDLSRGRECKFLAKLSITVLTDMIPLK